MLGQASMEYLLLSLVSLSLLSVSVLALGAIKDSSEKGLSLALFRDSALSLLNTANEVCALGDGNGREIALDADLSVESEETDEGWLVRFHSGDDSLVRAAYCEIEAKQGLSGVVYVENDEGKIRLTGR